MMKEPGILDAYILMALSVDTLDRISFGSSNSQHLAALRDADFGSFEHLHSMVLGVNHFSDYEEMVLLIYGIAIAHSSPHKCTK
jgi:hypothetical protein